MKHFFTMVFTFASITVLAQAPQIARVSSNGATTIYTDLKKAISEAHDNDLIYLPGSQFYIDSLVFKKRISLIGAGHYPDSTNATGRTVINGNIYCYAGGSGGSVQGAVFGDVYFGSSCRNFTISKCLFDGSSTLSEDVNTNYTGLLNIKECIVTNSLYTSSHAAFSILASNSFIKTISYCSNSIFINCIFSDCSNISDSRENDEFRNCIFNAFLTSAGYIFIYNGINMRYFNSHIANSTNINSDASMLLLNITYTDDANSTFQGGALPSDFSYSFDYRVKSSSAAAGSGTDGTDKGIYGSLHPYNPNPYNPHVYFKDIAPTTNAQGQLQISVKVKAQ